MSELKKEELENNKKKLQDYARSIIPGLSGLLGKRPEMYLPGGNWPTYYSRAKGVNIWVVLEVYTHLYQASSSVFFLIFFD